MVWKENLGQKRNQGRGSDEKAEEWKRVLFLFCGGG